MPEPRTPIRAAIEQAIETLIALLDALDGDADLEDGDADYVDEREADEKWLNP